MARATKSTDLLSTIAAFREKIADRVDHRAAIEALPPTAADVESKIRAQIESDRQDTLAFFDADWLVDGPSNGAKDLGFLERAINASTYGGFALILGTDVVVAGLMSHANAVLAKRGEGISDAERDARLAAVDDEIHRLCRDEEWAARQAERYGLEVERRDDSPVELLVCDDSELEGA